MKTNINFRQYSSDFDQKETSCGLEADKTEKFRKKLWKRENKLDVNKNQHKCWTKLQRLYAGKADKFRRK